MKKFIALLLALVMVLSLAACGGEEVKPQATNGASDEATGEATGEATTNTANFKAGFIFLHDENS
ncbi:MAG: BMP family ABC transporter substrate-binding protein, partial [Oscillospiraceae bacterium]|nr:BMP family ABC transporter substrate-binding protein [Oscillospiraceae bacterium]